MAGLAEVVKHELRPYLGDVVADTCVRATALSLGKSYDDLGVVDLPALRDSVSRYLAPIAPRTVIDSVLNSIEAGAR